MSRYARRTDRNHAAIVRAWRAAGCSVLSLAPLGKGAPDALVGYRGVNTLAEIKREEGPRGGRSGAILNGWQREWQAKWRGGAVVVVRTVDEALAAVGIAPESELRRRGLPRERGTKNDRALL